MSGVEFFNINCAYGRRHLVGVPQAKKPDVIGAVWMKSVLGMPPEHLLAPGPELLVFIAFDREYVVDEISVLLRRPSKEVSKQNAVEDKKDLHMQRVLRILPPFPVGRGHADC